jgi:hypothetical protein
LTAVQSHTKLLLETGAMFRAKHTISGAISISSVCSLHFLAVNRNNLKDVVSDRTVVWAINDGVLCRGITAIYFINLSVFDC